MTAEELAQFFEDPKPVRGGWDAKCPTHEDRIRSFGIKDGDKGVVLNCLAGCDPEGILASKGLKWGDIMEDEPRPLASPQTPVIVESYIYRDEDGVPIAKKDRYLPKTFRLNHWDFERDAWAAGLNGNPSYPYNLPELLAAKRDKGVFFVEGEKAARALERIGVVAAAAGGATGWKTEWAPYFEGARKVVIIPDNDDPGRLMAAKVFTDIQSRVKDVQVVELPDLPPKGDAYDWVEKGGTKEALLRIVDSASSGFRIYRGADLQAVRSSPTKFIVGACVQEGLTLLVGAPKTGKSLIGLEICNAVARGTKALNALATEPGRSVFFSLEDDVPLVRDRVAEMYGDFHEDLCIVRERPGSILKNGWKNVDRMLEHIGGARLVVMDTLACIRGEAGAKGNAYFDDAAFGHAMHEWAIAHHLGLIVIHHDRKMKADPEGDPLDDISGSKGLVGAAAGVMMFRRKRFEDVGKLQVIGKTLADREYHVNRTAVNRWVIFEP